MTAMLTNHPIIDPAPLSRLGGDALTRSAATAPMVEDHALLSPERLSLAMPEFHEAAAVEQPLTVAQLLDAAPELAGWFALDRQETAGRMTALVLDAGRDLGAEGLAQLIKTSPLFTLLGALGFERPMEVQALVPRLAVDGVHPGMADLLNRLMRDDQTRRLLARLVDWTHADLMLVEALPAPLRIERLIQLHRRQVSADRIVAHARAVARHSARQLPKAIVALAAVANGDGLAAWAARFGMPKPEAQPLPALGLLKPLTGERELIDASSELRVALSPEAQAVADGDATVYRWDGHEKAAIILRRDRGTGEWHIARLQGQAGGAVSRRTRKAIEASVAAVLHQTPPQPITGSSRRRSALPKARPGRSVDLFR